MMFDQNTRNEISKIAKEMGVSTAALLAVAEVESNGRIFSQVRGRREPVIRFEGHYFDRFLKGDARLEAREEGLASPKAGAVKNPGSQAKRWQLLNRAIKINRTAALSSVSWGLGQVMGAHWQWLGYGSVDALVAEARSGVVGQIALMSRYIKKARLVKALQERDWTAFARTYNGPSFHKNKYDLKMEKAFKKHAKYVGERSLPTLSSTSKLTDGSSVLMFGDRGVAVKSLQKKLTQKGYVLVADGLFGLITDRVVHQFQRDHFLQETGIFGRDEAAILNGNYERVLNAARNAIQRSGRGAATTVKASQNKIGTFSSRIRKRLRKHLLSISRRMA